MFPECSQINKKGGGFPHAFNLFLSPNCLGPFLQPFQLIPERTGNEDRSVSPTGNAEQQGKDHVVNGRTAEKQHGNQDHNYT
jgi:hypothetical protein